MAYYSAKHDLFKHCMNIDKCLIACKIHEHETLQITVITGKIIGYISGLRKGLVKYSIDSPNLTTCMDKLERGINQFYKRLLNTVSLDISTLSDFLSEIVDLHEDVKWELLKAEENEGQYREIGCIDELVGSFYGLGGWVFDLPARRRILL